MPDKKFTNVDPNANLNCDGQPDTLEPHMVSGNRTYFCFYFPWHGCAQALKKYSAPHAPMPFAAITVSDDESMFGIVYRDVRVPNIFLEGAQSRCSESSVSSSGMMVNCGDNKLIVI